LSALDSKTSKFSSTPIPRLTSTAKAAITPAAAKKEANVAAAAAAAGSGAHAAAAARAAAFADAADAEAVLAGHKEMRFLRFMKNGSGFKLTETGEDNYSAHDDQRRGSRGERRDMRKDQ